MPYTYRTVKGSPLTHEEYDENFAYTETLMEETEAARDAAVSAGNFQGRWSDQHGSVAPPYAVAHNGRTWALNVELFDVTASEPSEANTDWTLLLGTVATKDTGTGPGEVPLNSDLPTFGTAATKDTGTDPGDVPLNSDLGTASKKNVGTAVGNVVEVVLDDTSNPGLPAISGRALTGLSHPIYETFNASPAAAYPPLYAARAWVNFDGIGHSIRASGNIASITYNGTGDYTLNFTTPMPDTNYVVQGSACNNIVNSLTSGASIVKVFYRTEATMLTTSVRIAIGGYGYTMDPLYCSVAIVR